MWTYQRPPTGETVAPPEAGKGARRVGVGGAGRVRVPHPRGGAGRWCGWFPGFPRVGGAHAEKAGGVAGHTGKGYGKGRPVMRRGRFGHWANGGKGPAVIGSVNVEGGD